MVYVMLVGAYPFERPEDKHDNQKLQKMIQVCTLAALPLCEECHVWQPILPLPAAASECACITFSGLAQLER